MPSILNLDTAFVSHQLHDAVGETGEPEADTDQLSTGNANTVRSAVLFNGTVTSCGLRIWFHIAGTWFRGPITEGDTALDPTLGSQAIDWAVGGGSRFWFEVIDFAGTGTVDVYVQSVRK